MENTKYIPIMIQSLKKKSRILDMIMELNQRQRDELENPALDPSDFDKTVEEKAAQIDAIDALDVGFQELFDKVKEELRENREMYREEIAQMQGCIRDLTEKSASIQVQEAQNKALMEKKFAAVKHQIKEVRQSQKVVNQYYRNMMKTNFIDPQFTDKKK